VQRAPGRWSDPQRLVHIPLLMMRCKREVMEIHVNRPMTTIIAWICALAITAMSIFLIYQQFLMS
jgi:Mn2+/Fe2+ NRAMP family transporter